MRHVLSDDKRLLPNTVIDEEPVARKFEATTDDTLGVVLKVKAAVSDEL